MVLWSSWSRRKREQSESPLDPFLYNEMPRHLRVQIIHIFNEIDREASRVSNGMSHHVVKFLREELGVFELVAGFHRTGAAEFTTWFLSEVKVDRLLDAIEFIFNVAPCIRNQWTTYNADMLETQIKTINARMMEAAFGYQYEGNKIIQMTDEFNHKEVVLPTLQLISDSRFKVVQEEFLEGHSAFRKGDYENTLVECAKAFESCLKIISAERKWGTSENDNASRLISAAFENDFIPVFMKSEFTALRSMLDSAVPTLRNKSAAHGQGNSPRTVSISLARFQLNQTAAVIRFLVDLDSDS